MQVTTIPQVKAYESHIDKLVQCLPMDDSLFIAKLSKHKLLPGNINNKIETLQTEAEKSLYFLNRVIKPALNINDTFSFDNLLSVMEHCGYAHVKKLSCVIKSEISNTEPGMYYQ